MVERDLAKVEVAGSSPVIRLKRVSEKVLAFCFICSLMRVQDTGEYSMKDRVEYTEKVTIRRAGWDDLGALADLAVLMWKTIRRNP